MPSCVTMLRAISLACSRSFCAPLEASPRHHFLGGAPAEQNRELILQLLFGGEEFLLDRELQRVSPSAATPCGMIDTLCSGSPVGTLRATKVCPDSCTATRRFSAAFKTRWFLLRSGDDAVYRLLEIGHRDRRMLHGAPPGSPLRWRRWQGPHRRSPACACATTRRSTSTAVPCGVYAGAGSLRASGQVRLVDDNLPVEAAGAHQGRVKHLGPVGRGHHDDADGSNPSISDE